jgi:hypothetical protein
MLKKLKKYIEKLSGGIYKLETKENIEIISIEQLIYEDIQEIKKHLNLE